MNPPELSHSAARSQSVLVVGVGSPRGDDRIGWEVIDCLQQRQMPGVQFRVTAAPLDLLDWMENDLALHIVDACDGLGRPGQLMQYQWNESASQDQAGMQFVLRGTGTHDYGVVEVLQLAGRLKRLPEDVTVWGLQGERFDNSESLSPTVAARLSVAADAIEQELDNARTIIGAVAADAG